MKKTFSEMYERIKLTKKQMGILSSTPDLRLFYKKMTFREQEWALAFEWLHVGLARMDAKKVEYSFGVMVERYPLLEEMDRFYQEALTLRRINPVRLDAEKDRNRRNGKSKGIYKARKAHYTENDWLRDADVVTLSPEVSMIDALDAARTKSLRSLEKLAYDSRLSKEAKEALDWQISDKNLVGCACIMVKGQIETWYEVFKTRTGIEVVRDHGRLLPKAIWLERRATDSVCERVIIDYNDGRVEAHAKDPSRDTVWMSGVSEVPV
jgi:hypothetical protein